MSYTSYRNFDKVYWDNLNIFRDSGSKRTVFPSKKTGSGTTLKILKNKKTFKKQTDGNFSKFYVIVSVTSLFFLSIILTSSFISSIPAGRNDFSNIINSVNQNPDKILEDYLLFDDADKSEKMIGNIFNKVSFHKYRVQKNDTAEKIAKKFKITTDTVLLASGIKKNKNLKAGALLTIPDQNGRVVTVKSNDSVLKFAKMYGVGWEKISDINDLKSSVLHPGSRLFIPESQMTKYEKDQYYEQIFIWPVRGKISSYFGSRIDPFTGIYGFHTGIDIKTKEGTKVGCAKDGKVVFIGYNVVYGNFVMVKHSDNIMTTYAHLSRVDVQKDMEIKQGDSIGAVGMTGRSTGPHLHFEVIKNGKYINPLDFLK